MAQTGPDAGDLYGWLRSEIGNLTSAGSDDRRELFWTGEHERLGVARDPRGRIEIFVSGPELQTTSRILTANLTHDTWLRAGSEQLVANRLLLPSAAHFDAIAAYICVELLNNGIVANTALGFRRTEPVIEMAIERSRLQGESLVGLCGELLVMNALLDQSPDARTRDIILSWHGHVRSSRDFQLDGLGLEVKTTRGSSSTHRVQGVRQVEIGHSVDGSLESSFFMVSIGIEELDPEAPPSNSWTLPDLVDTLLLRIREAVPSQAEELCNGLLGRIRVYGSGEGEGYDHQEMKHRTAFGQPWQASFVRSYDMEDAGIMVLHSEDLAPFPMVDASSVEFTIKLPPKIDGDLNPVRGLAAAAGRFVALAWG